MVKIRLNNLTYRYDVYQIVSLFYKFDNVDFVEEGFDIDIVIDDGFIIIKQEDIYEKFYIEENISFKENIKKIIFIYFSKLTGKNFPWGTLVGIRPSKIALSLIEGGKEDEEIVQYFKEHYLAREDKAKLCIDVAKVEKEIVNKDSKSISIYIGMPFCPTKCLYCSFASNPISGCKSLVKPYLEALYFEIKEIKKYIEEKKLKIESVYFGGGTPTAVDDSEFEATMNHIYENFIFEKDVKEFTVECGRPDSITINKLETMKKYGVHRISINPQTMNDKTLKLIGRNHSVQDVIEKFNMARQLGFDNINMDIIVGLSGESLEEINRTCEEILKLAPESVTVHGMSIKRASRLHENIINNKKLEEANHNELNRMYERTVELSKELDIKPYYMYRQKNMVGNMENVGYSKEGNECIYNIQMIEEKQTIIALGADAVSKVVFLEENRIERFGNVKDVKEYVNRVQEMINKKLILLNTLYN